MIAEYQRAVARLLFELDAEPHVRALATDELSAQRWRVYRRMVRQRLRECIDDSFPRTRAVVGAESWARTIDRFFHESPPKTPYLRAVPGEVAAFLERVLDGEAADWTVDLARYEWALLDVAITADERGAEETNEERENKVVELTMDRPVVLTPAHRLLRLRASVHRVPIPQGDASIDTSVIEEGAFAVVLYRDPSSHRVRALELTPVAAAIFEEIERADRPLVDSLRAAADRARVAIDADFVQSFAEVGADWMERGLWLGSR